ncbi:MAG TPA: hypothetical protein VF669_19685 [Tepidisphaeraceae bacterium]
MHLDWMTLAIEIVGIFILCVWIVIPVQEFRDIFRKLRAPSSGGASSQADPSSQERRS